MKHKCLLCRKPVRLRFFPFAVSDEDDTISIKEPFFSHTKCLLEYALLEIIAQSQRRIMQESAKKADIVNASKVNDLVSEVFTFSDPSRRMH